MRQLFFHNLKRCYFLVLKDEDGVPCQDCGLLVMPADCVFVARDFFRMQEQYYCASCFEPKCDVLSASLAAYVSLVVPLNSVVVPFERPQLVASKATVFESAAAADGSVVGGKLGESLNPFQSMMLAEPPRLLIDALPARSEAEAATFLEELQGMQSLDSKGFEALVFKEAGAELRLGSGEVRKAVLLDRPKMGAEVNKS